MRFLKRRQRGLEVTDEMSRRWSGDPRVEAFWKERKGLRAGSGCRLNGWFFWNLCNTSKETYRKGTTPWGQRKKWSNKRSEARKLTGDWWPPEHTRRDARMPRKCWQQLNWVRLQNPRGSGIRGPWYLFNVVRIRMGLQKQEHWCMSVEEPAGKISTPLSPTAGVCNPVPIWGLVSVRKR